MQPFSSIPTIPLQRATQRTTVTSKLGAFYLCTSRRPLSGWWDGRRNRNGRSIKTIIRNATVLFDSHNSTPKSYSENYPNVKIRNFLLCNSTRPVSGWWDGRGNRNGRSIKTIIRNATVLFDSHNSSPKSYSENYRNVKIRSFLFVYFPKAIE